MQRFHNIDMDSNSETREFDWHGAMMVRRLEDRLPFVARGFRESPVGKRNARDIGERYEAHDDDRRHKMGELLRGFARVELQRSAAGLLADESSEPLPDQRVEDFPDRDPETGSTWTIEKRRHIKKYNVLRAAGLLDDTHTYLKMPHSAVLLKKAEQIINKANARHYFSTIKGVQGSASEPASETLGFVFPPDYESCPPDSGGGLRLSHHDPIQHMVEEYIDPQPEHRVRKPHLSHDSTDAEIQAFLQLPPEAPENHCPHFPPGKITKRALSKTPGDLKREVQRVRGLYDKQDLAAHKDQMDVWCVTSPYGEEIPESPCDSPPPKRKTKPPTSASGSNSACPVDETEKANAAHAPPQPSKSKGKQRAVLATVQRETERANPAHAPQQFGTSQGRKRAASTTLVSEPPRKSGRTTKLTVRAQEAKQLAKSSKCVGGARA